jgi:hypothetical protein
MSFTPLSRLVRSPVRSRPRDYVRPRLESLEDRTAPATIAWINPVGGSWDVATNWDLGRTPQSDDDVVIGRLDYGAVVDHATGNDTVQSVSSPFDGGTLAVTDLSTLRVTGSVNIPNLVAATAGVVSANNTGSLNTNLRAEGGGEIHLPALTDYNAAVFTRLEATGAGSLIDLPALTTMIATTGGNPVPGEVRLDVVADQSGTVNLPALTSVRGHPADYFIGFTALRASSGGTFVLDMGESVTFAAAGSLEVDTDAAVAAGPIVVSDLGDVTVRGALSAASVLVDDSSVTVSGSLVVAGGYTAVNSTTTLEGGTVTVCSLFDNQGGSVFGSGVINGSVRNAGLLNKRSLAVNGDFTQTASGQLDLQLRGAGDYDQLAVSGLASLDGTLDVRLAGAFQPQAGEQFQPVLWGQVQGAFATYTGDSSRFTFSYEDSGLTLVAD